jgi:hypothetical protein
MHLQSMLDDVEIFSKLSSSDPYMNLDIKMLMLLPESKV